jgi:hypothetical protein
MSRALRRAVVAVAIGAAVLTVSSADASTSSPPCPSSVVIARAGDVRCDVGAGDRLHLLELTRRECLHYGGTPGWLPGGLVRICRRVDF